MTKQLKKTLKFPCAFTYKIIGLAKPELIDKVIRVIQCHLPGDYIPNVKSSNKGNYLSVSITIFAKNFSQIKDLYYELSNINLVRMVL